MMKDLTNAHLRLNQTEGRQRDRILPVTTKKKRVNSRENMPESLLTIDHCWQVVIRDCTRADTNRQTCIKNRHDITK